MPAALGEVRAGAAGGHDEGSPAAGEAWRLRASGRRQRRASRGGRAGPGREAAPGAPRCCRQARGAERERREQPECGAEPAAGYRG